MEGEARNWCHGLSHGGELEGWGKGKGQEDKPLLTYGISYNFVLCASVTFFNKMLTKIRKQEKEEEQGEEEGRNKKKKEKVKEKKVLEEGEGG
jgi:uncharacterized transporter YbjL